MDQSSAQPRRWGATPAQPAQPPAATYRLQLSHEFGFDNAAAVVPYLAALGISHVHCSPYLQAVPGSTHGYDVVNHNAVSKELGGEEAHARFCRTVSDAGLGQVLDIVPNHMAISGPENAWWWDVLENGPSSRYASYFDVDWEPPEEKLRNTVLAPVLADHYGRVLEDGKIRLERTGAEFVVRYEDHSFPVAPRSLHALLAPAAERCGSAHLAFLADSFARLPHPTATDWVSVKRRHRDKEVLESLLARLIDDSPDAANSVDALLEEVNQDPDRLDNILDQQNYRLSFWRTAAGELGYRRFFDINTMAGLRAEDERVFADTHRLVLRWVAQGEVEGLRIDHPDGLRDPEGYFQRLCQAAPNIWVVAEKVLEPGEELPREWAVAGTTGYDFLNMVGGLFVDRAGEGPLTDFYTEFTGESADYAAVVHEKKRLILDETLASDVGRLTALLVKICEGRRRHRDYTRRELQDALSEIAACFPVYRSYVHAENRRLREADIQYITKATKQAMANRGDIDEKLFEFLQDLLLLRVEGASESEFVMRFQQLTGPVMAKAVEDTAFYCFNRLVSLNEVGSDPSRFGASVEEFHEYCARIQRDWPRTMVTTSTHDTKRSEDVRSRLHLLSELPGPWRDAVVRWSARNERHRRNGFPDRNAEYLLYQTLVGAWPITQDRISAYMKKASREAKQHTSWTEPDAAYDKALQGFLDGIFHDPEFIADLEAFVQPLIAAGRINSLAQTLIKLTSPGIPDIYQGTEIWDLSLVDPDNRRPVDYGLRRQLVSGLESAGCEQILARIDDGLPKLWATKQALQLRSQRPELFGRGASYKPLFARGDKAAHVVAFARSEEAITVTPRLVWGLEGNWGNTSFDLEHGRWLNVLTGDRMEGGSVPIHNLLRRFPVALLHRAEQR